MGLRERRVACANEDDSIVLCKGMRGVVPSKVRAARVRARVS